MTKSVEHYTLINKDDDPPELGDHVYQFNATDDGGVMQLLLVREVVTRATQWIGGRASRHAHMLLVYVHGRMTTKFCKPAGLYRAATEGEPNALNINTICRIDFERKVGALRSAAANVLCSGVEAAGRGGAHVTPDAERIIRDADALKWDGDYLRSGS